MVTVILPNSFLLYFLLDAVISSTVSWELIEEHSRHSPTSAGFGLVWFCLFGFLIDVLHYMLGKADCEILSSYCMSNRVPWWTDLCRYKQKPPFGDGVFPFHSSSSMYLKQAVLTRTCLCV